MKKHELNEQGVPKKGYWESSEIVIHENPNDRNSAILMIYQIEVSEIDLEKIASINKVDVRFTRK